MTRSVVELVESIVKLKDCEVDCCGLPESETWMATASALSAVVGVPEMTPVTAASVSPGGNAPLDTDH